MDYINLLNWKYSKSPITNKSLTKVQSKLLLMKHNKYYCLVQFVCVLHFQFILSIDVLTFLDYFITSVSKKLRQNTIVITTAFCLIFFECRTIKNILKLQYFVKYSKYSNRESMQAIQLFMMAFVENSSMKAKVRWFIIPTLPIT